MATESYEDEDLLLAFPEETPTSPVRHPKLKRLKKSSKSSPNPPILVPSAGPIVPTFDSSSDVPDDGLVSLFSVPAADDGFETLVLEVEEEKNSTRKSPSMEEEGKGEEALEKKKKKKKRNSSEELARGRRRMEKERQARLEQVRVSDGSLPVPIPNSSSDLPDDDLDPLFSVPAADEGFEILGTEEAKKKKSARKRLSMEEEDGISKKKKKNKKKSSSEESAREKRRMEKERQARLEQIHAESQRLLRETRNASFKPVPLVQKPISSVLEKIRLRKLEVLKRSGDLVEPDLVVNEIVENPVPNKSQTEVKDVGEDVEVEEHVEGVTSNERPLDPCASIPRSDDSVTELNVASHTSTNEREDSVTGFNIAFHTSTNEREDVGKSSKSTDDNLLNDSEDSSDVSLPTSNINHDPDNVLSEGEDDDKENIAPHASNAVNMDSSPSCGLAKVFLDDEAEEEDDSDHDLGRFQENEEDEESDENDFDDLIATGYEEASVDNEKRNELHQKWLEQQDAAGTDNLLQKLHCGQRQREPTSLDEEDSEEFDEEYEDEESNDLPVTSVVRQNAKKAKQMIAQMFTDGDDMYVPSDDEESEKTLIRQRVLKQSGESSFISPVEDEHSREFFGLIKKLNIAPTKRRGKITSSFDSLFGNSNSSSKTSFLNRTSSNSLPSLRKQGSTTMRAFIFGRDDSNSMSSIQASEKISESDLKVNQPSRAGASTKIRSCSQFKSTASETTAKTNSSSGASLFEILRHSSMHFDRQLKNNKGIISHEITESRASYQFSSFKLRTRK